MPTRSHTTYLCLALGACLLSAAAARADDARASIGVGAHVLSVARLQWLGVQPVLRVTADDLLNGYVELNEAAQLRISSNSRSGYSLEFQPLLAIFNAFTVRGLNSEMELAADGGSIVQRWQGRQSEDLNLSFRFNLAAGAGPGDYPLPVALRVRPLEPGE
jgi:hypothetical protein